ncbi:MAG: aminoglycoside 6-adenylyltransferase, partial [Lachnospiraceae bacterium]|nr:aminoglycoside 6-adenylyltransferase [Lachnospiraceae bacterium]
MWEKLFRMYDYFEELSIYVANYFGFPIDLEESKNVREFMKGRYDMAHSS